MSTSSSASAVCQYCGANHPNVTCHLIKAIEYHQNGTVKRVEFREANPNRWDISPPWANPIIS